MPPAKRKPKPTPKAKPAGVDMPARALREHYTAEATRLNLVLDHSDEVLIENACSTIDIIAALQRSIDHDGAVITTSQGSVKNNPATTEIRQQRLTLSKLQTLIEHRFTVAANAGRLTSTGKPPGTIAPGGYTGVTQRQQASARRPQQRRNQPLTPEQRAL
ncbi:P27 family phage terminase small subunit [Gordonia sputi]